MEVVYIMSNITLLPHQIDVLERTKNENKVGYFLDMGQFGLGKTYVSSEKADSYNLKILVVAQLSKVKDWCEHFEKHYGYDVYNLTDKNNIPSFIDVNYKCVGVINYDVLWRRKQLLKLKDFTLILDESSLISNETTKRAKFILKMTPTNTILLSGSLCGGKYERLWSQANLVGWNISKKLFYNQYIEIEYSKDGYPIITGYKNVERLKNKLRSNGCVFMKSEEVLDLPQQNFIDINVDVSKEYKKFMKSGIVTVGMISKDGYVEDVFELVGDTTLTKLLYARQLCGQYSKDKLKAFKDLIDSTEDRLIVFYNFNDELEKMKQLCEDRPVSIVNGSVKDLFAYENCDNSITFIQYQAGAMGLNLQKANKIVYFTPTLSSELFEQSKKRIHRIGQDRPCFYYQFKCGVEYKIYDTLSMRKDYTEYLFEG